MKSRSGTLSKTNQSDTLLNLTVGAVSTLSERVMADLRIAAPWALSDVNDSFEDDVNAVDNDGGRRTAFGVFSTTSDAAVAAGAGASAGTGAGEKAPWHSALQRLGQEGSYLGRGHQSGAASWQQRRQQQLESDMKLEVRHAVAHALLGRVGLRLWAAVRRDHIIMDQHLERCRTAMLSITDEMLWNLCSGAGTGTDDVGAASSNAEDPPAWPFAKGCWRGALGNMNAVAHPKSPYRKMQALAAVFGAIEDEVQRRALPSLTADTLLPVLLFVVCRTTLKFKHATVHYLQSFVEADRSIDRRAGRDLFCLANLDMVLRLAAKFPNFYQN